MTHRIDLSSNSLEESLPLLGIDKKKEENRKETDTQNEIQSNESPLININKQLKLVVTSEREESSNEQHEIIIKHPVYDEGGKVKNEALDRIKRAKYFSILFDCTPDVSHKKQLTEIIRYVRIIDKEVTIEETFIDFIATQEKKGVGLAGEITKKLFDDGLDINDCRGQGFDNGSNMAGIYNGVQAHILQKNKLAVFVPCAAHSLNLVGVHAAETSSTITTFFGIVQKMYTYFSGSTSRWEKLKSIINVTFKSHCGTRWSTKKQAISAIKNKIESIVKLLKTLSDDITLNHDTREGAKNLIYQINLKFICLINFWNDVLSQILITLINGLIRSIEEIRKIEFENALDEAKNTAKCLNISSEFKDKRKRKIPRKDSCEADDEGSISDDNNLRIQCFQSLDSIFTSLRWRFEKISENKSEYQFLTGNCLKIMSSDEIKRWVNDLTLKYENDKMVLNYFWKLKNLNFKLLN
ncbi:uncharacterized protein LOC126554084 [Aphis gossypii]|uniref:uncharacterized protein LOC126554084 n=1 Tax=Aphis gossypii TaxID=80765 RepID=UPI002158B79D|nr:uncharacterized protein LOC126554084 [Aphis gossypii]